MTTLTDAVVQAIDLVVDLEPECFEPIALGPTWMRNEDGGWVLPERTLGWQIIGWCAEYLLAETSTDEDPHPWRFTPEQMRFILWWYAVDEYGRFVYRKGVLQRLKGWGKDPVAAVLCMIELVGPSQFSHWATIEDVEDGNARKVGDPVGKAHTRAWVQVAAVSRDQTRNTMTIFPGLISEKAKAEYDIEMGAELIRARGKKVRLEAVTSSYRALEGGRSTFVILNETHHWVKGNNGDKMYETVDGNSTKRKGRYLAITNAYLPGEDSVAERMREAYEKSLEGKAFALRFMYDSLEAPASASLAPETARFVLERVRGDATWLDIDDIIQSIMDTTISPARSRRMWYNQIVADEDALFSAENWDPMHVAEILQPNDKVVLGFDGSKNRDATALVAIRVSDRLIQPLGIWERPDGEEGKNWSVPRESVEAAVQAAFALFNVVGFYADVEQWESHIANWSETYGEQLEVRATGSSAVGWDMRGSLKRSTLANEALMDAIIQHRFKVAEKAKPMNATNDEVDIAWTLRRHVMNTRRRENNYGVSFGKESKNSHRKVDGYAALLLAYQALLDWVERGKPTDDDEPGEGSFL